MEPMKCTDVDRSSATIDRRHAVARKGIDALSAKTCLTGVTTLSISSDQAQDRNHDRAEALFKKEERLREGRSAMAEYEAERHRAGKDRAIARAAAVKSAPVVPTKKRSA
jgi:hypothetical protein